MGTQGVDQGAGGEAEHAGVPGEVAGGEVFGRLVPASASRRNVPPCCQSQGDFLRHTDLVSGFDIAEAGLRRRRLDAEGDEPALGRQLAGLGDGDGEIRPGR